MGFSYTDINIFVLLFSQSMDANKFEMALTSLQNTEYFKQGPAIIQGELSDQVKLILKFCQEMKRPIRKIRENQQIIEKNNFQALKLG